MTDHEPAHLFKAFKNICLQQRRNKTRQSEEHFRATLMRLFADASVEELENLAIDVEDAE